MRIFVNEHKKLFIRSDTTDLYSTLGDTLYINGAYLQVKDSKYRKEIAEKVSEAVAGVLKEYEPLIAELDLKPIFDEKRRQLRESYDTDEALAKVMDVWDCAELTDRSWT